MKQCKECKQFKELVLFVKDKRKIDGTRSYCLKCQQNKHKQWRIKNKHRIAKYDKKFKASHPEYDFEYHSKWYKNNKKKKLAQNKLWKINNPAKLTAIGSKRRALLNKACPPWLSKEHLEQIQTIYLNCPDGYEVDHIIPICGKEVIGLHVPWNLQYLTPLENRKKSNKV